MEHPNKWVAKPDTWTTTTCDSCAVGCSIKIGSREGRGVIVRPGPGNEFSGDQICVRGRYHYDSLKPRERLSHHLVKRGVIQAPASLEDAATEAASALRGAASKGRVGVLVGGTVTNEEAYLARLIADGAFGTKADSPLGPVMRAAKQALEARLGTWRMATDMTRLPKAKAIVVIADDLEESHNVLSVRIKDAVAHQKATLVVIGSLRSELVDFATHWIRPAAGEEGQAATSLANAISGKAQSEEVATVAEVLRGSEGTIVVCAPNPVSPTIASAMTGGAANLSVALHGKAASDHLVVAPPEVNTHGLLDIGIAVEGTNNPLEGLTGLLVVRDDPTMRLPGAAAALQGLDALVVIDNVAHETAKQATVVLAEGRSYASKGTYTQGDFRIQRLEPAIAPEGDAVTCFAALSALAEPLNIEVPSEPETALFAIANEVPEYQPAADLIIGEGIKLEVPASGQGTITPIAEISTKGEGLRIITGRDQYTATDAAALRHPEAERLHRYDHMQVSEEDAERLGIANEDEIELTDGELILRAPVTITDRVPEGAIYVSSLLQGGAVVGFFRGANLPKVRLNIPIPA
tara:strand:+ start:406 stop:2142 length:1737 start_codon:yes stop_codon:yes gene_type:complete